MPVIILLVLALFGLGYLNLETRTEPAAQAVVVEPPTIAAEHASWARACQAKLAEAAHEFESVAGYACMPGSVTVTTLPSGVEYVEYTLQTADGALYQAAITEEPDDAIVGPGWQHPPGCHGFTDFRTFRHDHDRLGMVSARSDKGRLFAQYFASAADFCVEQAQ